MLSWSFTLLVVLGALLVWFWQVSLSVRERANRAAQDACERAQLQFLDGTVAFSHLQVARNELGRITLRRTYVFDYTAASIERRQGFVVMLGQRLEHIGFAASDAQGTTLHINSAPTRPQHVTTDDDTTHEAKVLNLEDWRRRKANQPPSGAPSTGAKPSDSSHDNGW